MTTSQPPKPNNEESDSAQRDAERLNHHYPLSFLLKLLALLLILFLIMCIVIYVMAGTSRGTKFLLEKIVAETGVELEYGEGNLRDGLLVKDFSMSVSENIDIHFINTYVKIGWRAIFAKEVHLRDADIELIEIVNHKPATGEPFDYKTFKSPVNLRFDQARINKIIYNQVGKKPIKVTDVLADDLSWIGTELEIGSANLQYSNVVNVADLSGIINLEDNYPLDLTSTITVNSLEKVYIDPIEVAATGSLKRTYGTLKSKYNDEKIAGEFSVQGLDKNAPFNAKLFWDDVSLPYAEGQDIHLVAGIATASGVLSDIELRINTQLLANDIPSGSYQGRAKIIDTKKILINRLTAETPEGDLLAKGVIYLKESFNLKAMIYSNNFQVRQLLPENAQPYAPKVVDGKLAVVLDLENEEGLLQIKTALLQRDGEVLKADIVRGDKPNIQNSHTPWSIDASWQNLIRTNIPQVGTINSPSGTATVLVDGEKLSVSASTRINELNVAPAGDYKVQLNKLNNKINIQGLDYNGEMGDLKGEGKIILATKNNPLTWSINAQTKGLKPQSFNKDIPITRLVGNINAKGQMIDINRRINGKVVKGQRHVFDIKSADINTTLTALVKSDSPDAKNQTTAATARRLGILGKGDGTVEVINGSLRYFDARFNGEVNTQGVPKGNFQVDANGTTKKINIKTFKHSGEAGNINASGNVDLTNGVQWNVTGNAKDLNIGYFAPQTSGIVSGDLKTSGKWRDNKTKYGDLSAFDVKFNGSIDTPQLPKGKLIIDAEGDSQAIKLRQFSHVGEAGSINAKGTVNIKEGINWNLNTQMNNFNLGYFLKEVPSTLSGNILTSGSWNDSVQRINIQKMTLNGRIKDEPVLAQGSLDAVLHLPKNMTQYLEGIKGSDTNGQVKQVKSIIETLNANNLLLQWGDNQVVANGNSENLQAKVSIRDLSQVSDSFSGKVLGGVTLVQPKGQSLPTLYVDLTSDKINLPGLVLENGSIKGKIVDLAKSPSTLAIVADTLKFGDSEFEDLNAVFKGTEQDHSLILTLKATKAKNDVGFQAAIKGGFDRNLKVWDGAIGKGKITTKYITLAQSQPAELKVLLNGPSPKVELAAHCWQSTNQKGKLCLRENLIASSEQGQVNIAIQDIDTTIFAPFMPKDLSWQANLNGKAVAAWKKGSEPSLNATLYSDNGKIGMVQDGYTEAVTLPYKRVSLIVRSFAEGLKIRTDIDSGQGARGYADIVVDPYKENMPISGALVLNELNLALLKPFFPGMRRLEGDITMAGGLGGTLTSPVFYGDVNLKNATVALLDLPVNLTNINAKGKIRGQNATIDGSFMSGEGTGKLSGTVDWHQEVQAKLRITGERLVVSQPPLLFAEVSPDFNIIIKPQQKYINIVGAVSVPSATIRPPEANEEVITKSEDVVVLDRTLIGNIEEVLAVTTPWSINADIGVDLGSNVNFRGFGSVLPLAGALHITQQGQGSMKALGVVQVSRRSNIDAFGQNLELNYGQLRFNGDVVDPQLSIEAVKEIESRTVGLRIKGQVSDPNIVVFNDAGLSQQQAMNALVTGRISNPGATQISEEGFKSEVTNNLAAAGLSLGLSGTRRLTNSIGDAFGLERLTIDASGTDNDANVNVTGYITPDLYIRYGVGVFNAQNKFSLRYQLTRRIYIEATSAAENAVDVVYSFQF